MERILIRQLFSRELLNQQVLIKGWVRSIRRSKKFSFIMLNDGSCFADLQVVADSTLDSYHQVAATGVGAALTIRGKVVESRGKQQRREVQAISITMVGKTDPDYPLQKKRHSLEFLREKAHLRPRTRTLNAVFRTRHCLSIATHQFFHQRGFYYLHSPVITALDCEGAGEMFQVTTFDLERKLPRNTRGRIDYTQDYFGVPTYLTVSGQLSAECFAQGLGATYTFGPTFRSENSHTARHLAEFWMVEPEVAFCDLNELTQLASDYFKFLVQSALEECEQELAFLHQHYAPHLTTELQQIAELEPVQITYTEAVTVLQQAPEKFEFTVEWGKDLQTEHERFLTEKHFKRPVIVIDYPQEIKAFYMKLNGDGKTVRAMDFLVPGVGELIGGSQREEDYQQLQQRLQELGLSEQDYWWYLELRRFGTTPHSGFGLGLERMMMYLTGMSNIRDVIAFPRTPQNAVF